MKEPDRYEIRVEGLLSDRWADWFAGLAIEPGENGETRLYGPLSDQSALLGVLNQLHALNLPIISVNRRPQYAGKKDDSAVGIA